MAANGVYHKRGLESNIGGTVFGALARKKFFSSSHQICHLGGATNLLYNFFKSNNWVGLDVFKITITTQSIFLKIISLVLTGYKQCGKVP
jgi:hypothetical protein